MKKQPGSEKGEDLDVREVHGQLLREKSEPSEMLRAAPGWLKHGVYAPLLIWGAFYFFNASGGFHWDEYNEGPRSTLAMVGTEEVVEESSSPPTRDAPVASLKEEGKKVYESVCFACHQATGLGLPGAFPPLDGSEWVSGNEKHLALIVLHGLSGPIEVKGQPWNSMMPPHGPTLDDRQIAAVLSYVRSAWGNRSSEVAIETVTEMRAEFDGHAPWTAAELEKVVP